jgi:uncharacterized protein
MPVKVNLRHLEVNDVHLRGELAPEELDIDSKDEVIKVEDPLSYDIVVQQVEDALLVTGKLSLPLKCQCVRCLKPHGSAVSLEDWTLHLPLQGEESVPISNDLVDLTPFIREDILLEFPQHPLCDPECRGLPGTSPGKLIEAHPEGGARDSSAWAELNKLKL